LSAWLSSAQTDDVSSRLLAESEEAKKRRRDVNGISSSGEKTGCERA
jgi:hypothetical protein